MFVVCIYFICDFPIITYFILCDGSVIFMMLLYFDVYQLFRVLVYMCTWVKTNITVFMWNQCTCIINLIQFLFTSYSQICNLLLQLTIWLNHKDLFLNIARISYRRDQQVYASSSTQVKRGKKKFVQSGRCCSVAYLYGTLLKLFYP